MKLEEKGLARLQCLEEAVAARLPKVDLVKILVPCQELEPVLVSDSDEGTHVAILSGSRSRRPEIPDRKSTRLNSSHTVISYAVFCLKKKKQKASEERKIVKQ